MTDTPHRRPARAVSVDLFGTLVEVSPPPDPARAVATALGERGVAVPDDWQRRYGTPQIEATAGAEISLYDHVVATLQDGGETPERAVVEAAVDDAFDPAVETAAGAEALVHAVGEHVPVGVLSNSAVPGLVERTIERAAFPRSALDAVIPSVDCGVRKPDPRAFAAAGAALGVPIDDLLHVGDDPETDGGIEAAGGQFVAIDDASVDAVLARVVADP